ncbi:MAG: methyltransferase [Candidatus Symbiodolus clandestinus]
MNTPLWQQISLSPCETFHLLEERPLYPQRFTQVMKYHAPGLAPAKDAAGAFHIDLQGQAAYSSRFLETFGFYEGLAAVCSQAGWLHIHPSGEAGYPEHYAWCGNFQEGHCPVKNRQGYYYHINHQGARTYSESYAYVGDFKEGMAVVCNQQGLQTHINYQGDFTHGHWFLGLGVYHKGVANAQDRRGHYHIDRQGHPLYAERYARVEPFYNGVAWVETLTGAYVTLDLQGKPLAVIRPPQRPLWQQLSADMVGFWRTKTIACAIRFRVLEDLPATTTEIAQRTNLAEGALARLLRALWELAIVYYQEDSWHLTEKGQLLSPADEKFLAAAAVMWSDVNDHCWHSLEQSLLNYMPTVPRLFKASASDEKLADYHRAIDGYAANDFLILLERLDWEQHDRLIGVGRSAKVLLEQLLQQYSHLQARLLGDAYLFKHLTIPASLTTRYVLQPHSPLHPWPASADAILLPRVLHYYSDPQTLTILRCIEQALLCGGKIYLLETLLEEQTPQGGLLDLNMWVESGGQLRTLALWQQLFEQSGLCLQANQAISSGIHLLTLQRSATQEVIDESGQ